MQISEPAPKEYKEMILPLINVVFLLLIFLMLMGNMVERAAFEVTPAISERGEQGEAALRVFVSKTSEVSFAGVIGKEAALEKLYQVAGAHSSQDREILLRADSAADLSEVLRLAKSIQRGTGRPVKLEVLQK